jgi:hypothetical protein
MKTALVSLALLAAAASVVIAAEPVKVFVFTNEMPSGSVDEQLQARRESLQDLVKALSTPTYTPTLTLVSSRQAADVIVELVSRGENTTSASSSSTRESDGGSASASRSSAVTRQFLKFRISAGKQSHDLTTEAQLSWPMMAARAADDLAKWIRSSLRGEVL